MNRTRTWLAAGSLGLAAIGGCSTIDQVEGDEKTRPLAIGLNDSDAQRIVEVMTADALSRPWIDAFRAGHPRNPIIAVGEIKNKSDDYLQTELVTKQLEAELLNSGRVSVLAERDLRAQLRQERTDTEFTDPAFIKNMKGEHQVDYLMTGVIAYDREISRDRARETGAYQMTLELTDISSLQKVWIKSEKVKKVRRPGS